MALRKGLLGGFMMGIESDDDDDDECVYMCVCIPSLTTQKHLSRHQLAM